ncbi:MAG TPA: cytochrome c3 family protein [Candidatus Methanoperedens sp.]|nr:cytochrome c3 family protein [Candidatus Methanoperedens sp.]
MKSPQLAIAFTIFLSLQTAGVTPEAAAAGGPAIVHPPDMALLAGEASLDVLGWNNGAAALPLTVQGAGGAKEYSGVPGAFTTRISLSPGENAIQFGGRTVRVYLASAQEKAPKGFSPADPHAVDNGCEDCHALEAGAAKLLEAVPGLCARCHDDMLKDKTGKTHAVQHPPAEEGDCLACHRFHQRSVKRLPAEARRALCFGCHDDFTGGGKKLMHAPVAVGDCTGCHGAHGGAVKALLPASGVKLCVLCHADPSKKKDGAEWEVAHPALDDGCASCHLPHVSDNAGLLRRPQVQVCGECHDPFPVQEGGKDLVIHNPVEEGECAGCHAVHGTDVRKLLRASGKTLCVTCHTDPSKDPSGADWATPHPALDDGCLSCHLPHVAPAAGMLKQEIAPLCFECHDAFTPPESGGSLHRPVAQGRCDDCHAPHGSAAAKLLIASPEQKLCTKCHKDPALNPNGAEWAVPHPALDDGCPTCHAAHVSAAPRLLSKSEGELCAGCHVDKNRNSDGAEWSAPHLPVQSGLCGSCHGPHGAPEKGLLRVGQMDLCTASCHTETHERHRSTEIDTITNRPVKTSVTLPPGFPLRKKDGSLGCAGCHLPHGSDNPSMWNRPQQSFCPQCHQF